jgi:hypothetical protein
LVSRHNLNDLIRLQHQDREEFVVPTIHSNQEEVFE